MTVGGTLAGAGLATVRGTTWDGGTVTAAGGIVGAGFSTESATVVVSG